MGDAEREAEAPEPDHPLQGFARRGPKKQRPQQVEIGHAREGVGDEQGEGQPGAGFRPRPSGSANCGAAAQDDRGEGKDRQEYMRAKFGDGDRLKQIHARLEETGAAEGITFDFGAIKVSPNTLDAHRLIRWAAGFGEDVQGRVARRLFQLYFEEGADIGDRGVLTDAAREAGMDEAVVATLLATDADRDTVQAEIETASRMGITGVPCFLIEGKYAVMGAQDAETLADAIRQIAAAKAGGEMETAG